MNKSKLFSIGEVAKMFHVSISSLRHYEEYGLIKPEKIDQNSGYRYYSVRQFEILNTIRYLRSLDTPLSEIKDFLNNREIEKIEEKLQKQKDLVIKKQLELKRIERKIDNRLQTIFDAKNSEFDTIKLIQKEKCSIVWLNDNLRIDNFLDMETPIRRLEDNQNEAIVFLGKVGLGISLKNLEKKHFNCYDGIFLILDNEDNFKGEKMTLSQTLCVSIRFHGSHTESSLYYNKLFNYIMEHNLTVTSFSREVTLIDYGFTNNTKKFVTEISIPVKQ